MQQPPAQGVDPARDPVPVWTPRQPSPRENARAPLLGVLLVLATAGFVLLHGLALATGRGAATRTLAATLPALTDLDQALLVHGDAVRAAASDTELVPVPGLPFTVEISSEAARAGGEETRREVVAALTRAVYRSGSAAFRGDASTGSVAAPLSRAWLLSHALDLLSASSHARLAWWRTLTLGVTVLLAAGLAASTGPQRMAVAMGSAVAVGALFGVVLAAGAWAGMALLLSGNGDATATVLNRMVHDVAMTVIGTGLVVALVGTVVAATGVLSRRHGRGGDTAGAAASSRPARLRAP
ncbi:MAG: hypothetical protein C4290_07925 [Chloroflexota bacterium]